MTPALPLVVEPETLESKLGDKDLFVVDLSKHQTYVQSHIPGSVHIDYARIVAMESPVMGLLPSPAQLSATLSELGLTRDHHVIAYDDEGGGRAARLLWTLEASGHERLSLLKVDSMPGLQNIAHSSPAPRPSRAAPTRPSGRNKSSPTMPTFSRTLEIRTWGSSIRAQLTNIGG